MRDLLFLKINSSLNIFIFYFKNISVEKVIMSCEHLLEQFKTKLQTEGLRDQTIRSYIADTKQYCKWLDKHRGIPAKNANQNDAKAFLDYLQSEAHELRPGKFGTYSLSTVRRKIGILRRFYYTILEE